MNITKVEMTHIDDAGKRLRAFCSITFDDSFVVHDLKIIDGNDGLFVAMPNRKSSIHCGRCNVKNHSTAVYCNGCGKRFENKSQDETNGRQYFDVAHPISKSCREMIQSHVIQQFNDERNARALC